MQQGTVWMNAWVFHLVCLEGKIYGVQQLWKQWLPVPEITNQHDEGDADPFPLVMFVSFDAGE